MITAVHSLLSADATFMASLPGGLFNGELVEEVSRTTTPAAFDAGQRLRACALIKAGTQVTDKSFNRVVSRAARQTFRIFYYQRGGRDQINAARRRAFELLHQRQDLALAPGEGRCSEIFWLDDVLDGYDDALEVALILSRFQATMVR